MTQKKLTPDDWLLAGFEALRQHGPAALKAEALARTLNTTKGSFYWHFADVPAFHAAMLAYWEERAFSDVVDQLAAEPTSGARLRKLGQIAASSHDPAYGGIGAEPAVRAWARSDARVAEAVARVDQQRLDYLQWLLGEMKITNPEVARFVYAASIGMEDLASRDGQDNAGAMGTLVDLVLALR